VSNEGKKGIRCYSPARTGHQILYDFKLSEENYANIKTTFIKALPLGEKDSTEFMKKERDSGWKEQVVDGPDKYR